MPPAITKRLFIPKIRSPSAGEHFFQELELGFSHVTAVSSGSLLTVCHRSHLGFESLCACVRAYLRYWATSLNAARENWKALVKVWTWVLRQTSSVYVSCVLLIGAPVRMRAGHRSLKVVGGRDEFASLYLFC